MVDMEKKLKLFKHLGNCELCGTRIFRETIFCPTCGTKIDTIEYKTDPNDIFMIDYIGKGNNVSILENNGRNTRITTVNKRNKLPNPIIEHMYDDSDVLPYINENKDIFKIINFDNGDIIAINKDITVTALYLFYEFTSEFDDHSIDECSVNLSIETSAFPELAKYNFIFDTDHHLMNSDRSSNYNKYERLKNMLYRLAIEFNVLPKMPDGTECVTPLIDYFPYGLYKLLQEVTEKIKTDYPDKYPSMVLLNEVKE